MDEKSRINQIITFNDCGHMLKSFFLNIALLSFSSILFTQTSNATSHKKYALKGFDPVSYYSDGPIKGQRKFTHNYGSQTFKFLSAENLNLFKRHPEKYLPQYDGSCAYGMAISGKRYRINPQAYEVRNCKLYLFYRTPFFNALKRWKNENPKELARIADANWANRYE